MTMPRPGRCQAQDNLGATPRKRSLLNVWSLMWYMWRDVSWAGNILSDHALISHHNCWRKLRTYSLHIKAIKTTPTIPKLMASYSASTRPSNWCQRERGQGQTISIHTHLLFAYYTTGINGLCPFELVCVWPANAWPVGLKGEWETEEKSNESVVWPSM